MWNCIERSCFNGHGEPLRLGTVKDQEKPPVSTSSLRGSGEPRMEEGIIERSWGLATDLNEYRIEVSYCYYDRFYVTSYVFKCLLYVIRCPVITSS